MDESIPTALLSRLPVMERAANAGKPKYSHIEGVGSVDAITAKVLAALS